MKKIMLVLVLLVSISGCTYEGDEMKPYNKENLKTATFAGGCFWCMEAAYEGLAGVADVISGYSGGEKENPTYEEVSGGKTGHLEAIQVHYDPNVVSYKELVDLFWRQIDPTDEGGQFADRGSQYKTTIFYHDEEQKKIAEESKKALEESGKFDKPIVTQIRKFSEFFKAEEYHQDYSKKRVIEYKIYEAASGRKEFKKEVWEE
jgi:peptide methionine sulfoxide reductase msrA/msrB